MYSQSTEAPFFTEYSLTARLYIFQIGSSLLQESRNSKPFKCLTFCNAFHKHDCCIPIFQVNITVQNIASFLLFLLLFVTEARVCVVVVQLQLLLHQVGSFIRGTAFAEAGLCTGVNVLV